MLLVDLNYNFEFDWFVELSDNNLASELVGNRSFFKPITIEEIVIFIINLVINSKASSWLKWLLKLISKFLAHDNDFPALIGSLSP